MQLAAYRNINLAVTIKSNNLVVVITVLCQPANFFAVCYIFVGSPRFPVVRDLSNQILDTRCEKGSNTPTIVMSTVVEHPPHPFVDDDLSITSLRNLSRDSIVFIKS